MQELRDLARTPAVAGFVADPPNIYFSRGIQGVNLEVDRYWLRSYRTENAFWTETEPPSFSYRMRKLLRKAHLDFSWRPPNWAQYCIRKGFGEEAHPATIVVLLGEIPDAEFIAEAPRQVNSHPIRYEAREPCVAHAGVPLLSPGNQIGRLGIVNLQQQGTSTAGTLGGFLRSSASGQMYGISCEHVCGGPNTVVFHPPPKSPAKARVGEVRYATLPAPAPKCNRVIQPVPVPDLAVVEIDATVQTSALHPRIGNIHRVTPIIDMTSGDPVTFEGATSGYVEGKIGALNVWRTVTIHGVDHCVGDMFTIEPRQNWYVKPSLSRPGDSGAWILNQTSGITGWDGVLFGGDGVQAYCCFAELVYAETAVHIPNIVLP